VKRRGTKGRAIKTKQKRGKANKNLKNKKGKKGRYGRICWGSSGCKICYPK
jgi:hypothetical protein